MDHLPVQLECWAVFDEWNIILPYVQNTFILTSGFADMHLYTTSL